MPFPPGLITVRYTASPAVSHLGTGIRRDFTIRPVFVNPDGSTTPARLVHEASGTLLSPIIETAVAQEGATLTLDLPAVDQPGILGPDGLPVTDWAYLLDEVESHVEPYAGVIGTTPPLGTRRSLAPRKIPLQPRTADALAGLDLDLQPADGAAFIPSLGPTWVGRLDEAPDGVMAVYDEITDPTVGRLYLRSVAA